jgi:hypothetical protein
MITFEEIKNSNPLLILYPGGCGGEFVASTLSRADASFHPLQGRYDPDKNRHVINCAINYVTNWGDPNDPETWISPYFKEAETEGAGRHIIKDHCIMYYLEYYMKFMPNIEIIYMVPFKNVEYFSQLLFLKATELITSPVDHAFVRKVISDRVPADRIDKIVSWLNSQKEFWMHELHTVNSKLQLGESIENMVHQPSLEASIIGHQAVMRSEFLQVSSLLPAYPNIHLVNSDSLMIDGVDFWEEINKITGGVNIDFALGETQKWILKNNELISNYAAATFDLTRPQTEKTRITMALHSDCPIEVLTIMATHDTERSVILATACNPNVTPEIIDIILSRGIITPKDLSDYVTSYNLRESINQLKSTFCPIPWNHVSTNPDGTIRPCCLIFSEKDDKSGDKGEIRKDDGSVLTSNDKISENRNAPIWKTLRSGFLKGEKSSLCHLCWDAEIHGSGSHRQRSMDLFPNVITKAIQKTNPDGSVLHDDFPIEYWDLRFGNNCNLKCRTCGPASSNSWYDDIIALSSKEHLAEALKPYIKIENVSGVTKIIDTFNWYDDSILWDDIVDNLEYTSRFYFTGGEPTINNKHKELLKIMIDRGLSKNIDLDYNTNVAGLPRDMFDLWPHFKSVFLGMSVDGIYDHFEYTRHPGKWNAAERTIRKIDTMPELANVDAVFAVTVSVFNVLHVLDMQWWSCEQHWQRIRTELVLHPLYESAMYNIQNLPVEMKKYITKRYTQFIAEMNLCFSDNKQLVRSVTKQLTAIVRHMNSVNPEHHLWDKFIFSTEKLDKIRGEDWRRSLPDIADLEKYYNANR